jgi:hypothetical protein
VDESGAKFTKETLSKGFFLFVKLTLLPKAANVSLAVNEKLGK